MGEDARVMAILEREEIKNFTKDIRLMSEKELKKHFSFNTKKKLNATKLIKNLIWQGYTWIKQGKMEPIEGNIRTFWYISIKSVLSRLGLKVSGRCYTEKVYDTFVEMITVHNLFRYADFGFLDGRENMRTIGKKNGNLILFVEKDGTFSLVRKIAEKHDATGISLKGFPSYLTTEYLVKDMAEKGLLREPVHLFGAVDYDPSGYWIEQEFARQLRNYKVEIGSTHNLVRPDDLPKELLEICKYKLKPGSKTRNWMRETGGIDGEPFGLELDALGGKRIRDAYDRALSPFLDQPLQRSTIDKEREEFFEFLTRPATCTI